LHTSARRTREAQDPGWTLTGDEDGYASRGLVGWRIFLWPTIALVWLTGYRLARLLFRPLPSALLVVGGSVLVAFSLLARAIGNLD
jgi:hypothetical protein